MRRISAITVSTSGSGTCCNTVKTSPRSKRRVSGGQGRQRLDAAELDVGLQVPRNREQAGLALEADDLARELGEDRRESTEAAAEVTGRRHAGRTEDRRQDRTDVALFEIRAQHRTRTIDVDDFSGSPDEPLHAVGTISGFCGYSSQARTTWFPRGTQKISPGGHPRAATCAARCARSNLARGHVGAHFVGHQIREVEDGVGGEADLNDGPAFAEDADAEPPRGGGVHDGRHPHDGGGVNSRLAVEHPHVHSG